MDFGLIAKTLKHSFSKEIHALFADYDYEMCELDEEELPAFFEKRDFKAINVTIPYKQAVIPYLYEISEAAKSIGAVNTIVNSDGKLYGYNTDCAGMTALIHRAGVEIAGKTVAVLGTGGTSKTANYVANSLGAARVLTVSRKPVGDCIGYDDLYEMQAEVDVIINTTPCGMFPNGDSCPVEIDKFTKLSGVIDAVYNPLNTELVLSTKKRGIKAEGGLYMLVAQAAEAVRKFIGKEISQPELEAAFSAVLHQKQNIVLIGMPASGKSTLGVRLAKACGKRFIDTDTIIAKEEKRSISQIFEKSGERYFRDAEAAVIKRVAEKNGCIIATGGGAVLREENVHELKKNGVTVFIDRPLSKLCGTPDRPLSQNSEQLAALYEKRLPIYRAAADIVFTPSDDIDENVSALEKLLKGGDAV